MTVIESKYFTIQASFPLLHLCPSTTTGETRFLPNKFNYSTKTARFFYLKEKQDVGI